MAARVVMNRAKRGLYAGRHIQFGNKVSEDGGNSYLLDLLGIFFLVDINAAPLNEKGLLHIIVETLPHLRSRRTWKPNVQTKRIFSLALDHYIRINLTTHALRSIDKAGGLDEYLLNIPDRKLENENALFWKRKIASVYNMLAQTEIAIPVQNPADGTFSLEVRADPFPTNEKSTGDGGNPKVDLR